MESDFLFPASIPLTRRWGIGFSIPCFCLAAVELAFLFYISVSRHYKIWPSILYHRLAAVESDLVFYAFVSPI